MFETLKKRLKEFKRGKSGLIEDSSLNPTSIERVGSKRRNVDLLEVGALYMLISNNKDNITVASYIGEHEYEHKKFTLSVFKDVLTGDEIASLAKPIRFTETRFTALSKLHFHEVISILYFQLDDWEVNVHTMKDDGSFINPWEHYKKVMNKLKDTINVNN